MALAARMLAARANGQGDFDPVSHRVFALVSDAAFATSLVRFDPGTAQRTVMDASTAYDHADLAWDGVGPWPQEPYDCKENPQGHTCPNNRRALPPRTFPMSSSE